MISFESFANAESQPSPANLKSFNLIDHILRNSIFLRWILKNISPFHGEILEIIQFALDNQPIFLFEVLKLRTEIIKHLPLRFLRLKFSSHENKILETGFLHFKVIAIFFNGFHFLFNLSPVILPFFHLSSKFSCTFLIEFLRLARLEVLPFSKELINIDTDWFASFAYFLLDCFCLLGKNIVEVSNCEFEVLPSLFHVRSILHESDEVSQKLILCLYVWQLSGHVLFLPLEFEVSCFSWIHFLHGFWLIC